VWFEVMLIASFVLIVLAGRPAQVRGAFVYLVLNLLSSLLFLAAVGLLYGSTGTLNIADLAVRVEGAVPHGLRTTLALLLLCAFGIKAALFPLFVWLPESYAPQPAVVSALFAGLLTKVGVYALIRVFTLVFGGELVGVHTVLLVLSVLTMLAGVLGALVQTDLRRILSFQLVAHIGYMTMALALYTPFAIAAAIFYLVHDIVVKTNLFLVSGLVGRASGGFDLRRLGGLYRARPLLALAFLVSALSLAGVPPLSGFWAKLLVVKAGLDGGAFVAVAAALLAALATLTSMATIWARAFWAPPQGEVRAGRYGAAMVPVAVLAATTVLLGLWARPLFAAASRAGGELIERTPYIEAVLGGAP
jgi:multicomponent Na+:H+ antiporter subunit D